MSNHINESKTQPPERAHSRSDHSRSAASGPLAFGPLRGRGTPITPIARVFTELNRLPETTISNILSCYENVSSAQKKIEELQEIEVCESPPLLDESFYLVKPIDYTIEKMQRLVAEKNRQIEQLKKSYSDQFKHLKKANGATDSKRHAHIQR